MDQWQIITLVLYIALGLGALWLIVMLSRLIYRGAIELFLWASDWEFLGVAAYFACWVFIFPLMLVGSAIVGFFARQGERSLQEETFSNVTAKIEMSRHNNEAHYEEPMSEYEKKRGF